MTWVERSDCYLNCDFLHFQVNCTFNDADVKQWMMNKPENETTTLSWQMALAWGGGVVLFLLLGKFNVVQKLLRKVMECLVCPISLFTKRRIVISF